MASAWLTRVPPRVAAAPVPPAHHFTAAVRGRRLAEAVHADDLLSILWLLLLLRGAPGDATARALGQAESSGQGEAAELLRQHLAHGHAHPGPSERLEGTGGPEPSSRAEPFAQPSSPLAAPRLPEGVRATAQPPDLPLGAPILPLQPAAPLAPSAPGGAAETQLPLLLDAPLLLLSTDAPATMAPTESMPAAQPAEAALTGASAAAHIASLLGPQAAAVLAPPWQSSGDAAQPPES